MLQAAAWGAVMDVVVRLRCLGLGKYEAAFRELPSAPIKPRSSRLVGNRPRTERQLFNLVAIRRRARS